MSDALDVKSFDRPLDHHSLAQLFLEARSFNGWLDKSIDAAMIDQLYALTAMGPTSANSLPARFVFLRSADARERIIPHLLESNRAKTRTAPVCVIIAYDQKFYNHIPRLFPHNPEAQQWFSEIPAFAEETAFRNSSLQGAYLMLAARGLGLDCGPLSGFDATGVDAEFFPDGQYKSNFLCNIGYGDSGSLLPRLPRLDFDEACKIL